MIIKTHIEEIHQLSQQIKTLTAKQESILQITPRNKILSMELYQVENQIEQIKNQLHQHQKKLSKHTN